MMVRRYQPAKGEEVLIRPDVNGARCHAGVVLVADYPERGGRMTYPRLLVRVDQLAVVEMSSPMDSAFWWVRERSLFGCLKLHLEPLDLE